jgi:hypothetical protein
MVFGTNPEADAKEFEGVLEKGRKLLTGDAEANVKNFMGESSSNFEEMVYEALKKSAIGTNFENYIEMVTGHKFPDIVFNNRFYGVEVKSLKHEGWSTFGNSIFESTRVENIDRIYILAGRLSAPIEFKYKKYEDCIDDIQVTHSPRYHIDMDVKEENTIFKKIGIPYETFRGLDDPLSPLRKYYKKKLKPGEGLWWLENDAEKIGNNNLVVKVLNDLPDDEREKIMVEGFARFPKLLGGDQSRYKKFATWLIVEHGLVSHNVRDFFSAGGQKKIVVDGKKYVGVPKIYFNLQRRVKEIKEEVDRLKPFTIYENWEIEDKYDTNKFKTWIDLVEDFSKKKLKDCGLPIRKMLMNELKK